VDDEPAVCISLQGLLAREGYQTYVAADGPTALQVMGQREIDLVLLDLNMPGMDGLELMHIIHKHWPLTELIILTGYGALESALAALRHGAHDYLLKPSTPEDITASIRRGLEKRLNALHRRSLLTRIEASVRELTREGTELPPPARPLSTPHPRPGAHLSSGEISIDLQQHRVSIRDQEIVLTPTEFSALVYLVRQKGRVASYTSIVKNTHGYDCSPREARTLIKTHISHLRHKLQQHSCEPCPITNVRGVGYVWSDGPGSETNQRSA
jgi:DNA-binding response OmpR family regulator